MALDGLFCADVLLRTHSVVSCCLVQKLNYLNYYDRLQREPNSPSLVVEYSRAIEADEGRQNIRISEGPVPTIVLNAHQMLHPASQASSASPIFLGDASVNIYSP